VKPARMQRKRTKGWNMQEASRAINGLDAVYVGRPSKWGNLWPTAEMYRQWIAGEHFDLYVEAINRREWWDKHNRGFVLSPHDGNTPHRLTLILYHLPELRGKNLCCWCSLTDECHGDVLLELANKEDSQ